ncbi:MAG: dihydroneopterin aldolase [Campylobacterota bacterium]|nr:dihydroneopterin aldolase [Campylobacterota bacterium]
MRVYINDLKFKAIIGILDFERVKAQKVIVDIEFDYDFDGKFFVDYSKVSTYIKNKMIKNKYYLIEDALIDIKRSLKKKYKLQKIKLKITKPTILDDCIVSVGL